jgi:poly(A) polymerase
VEQLEALGLYAYLQPNAFALMKKQKGFRERYIHSLSALKEERGKDPLPEILAALIRDYLEDHTPWDGDQENYKQVFMDARRFVLPLSPPRLGLDRALRLIFKEHGVSLKKIRLPDREKLWGDKPSKPEEEGEPPDTSGRGHKKPRRRKS